MAMRELFTTDIGLLSLFMIGFILAMAVFIWRFVKNNIRKDSEAHHLPHRKIDGRLGKWRRGSTAPVPSAMA